MHRKENLCKDIVHDLVFDGGWIPQKCSSRLKPSDCCGHSKQQTSFSCSPNRLAITCASCARASSPPGENLLPSGRQGQHGWMLSLDEPFIHRTNMITRNGFEFIGIYLGLWGVQWASTVAGKTHSTLWRSCQNSSQCGKQLLVTLLSTWGWLMTTWTPLIACKCACEG